MNSRGVERILGDVVTIVSGQVDPCEEPYASLPHVGGDNIESNSGRLAGIKTAAQLGLTSGKYLFDKDCVLYSKIRPNLNKVAAPHFEGICSADIYPIRPLPGEIDKRFLVFVLRSDEFLAFAARHSSRTNIPKINREALLSFQFPLPPLPEQQRIAGILDQADAIRRKRAEAVGVCDEFLKSVFLEMFGDPVTNPKGLPQIPLGDAVDMQSGGTPSKARPEYWTGRFPWISPKDMKRLIVDDSQDHVSDLVFAETTLKKIPAGSVLIVVRGMILVHTVPVALTACDSAINQDMKAMIPRNGLMAEFLLYNLIAQHDFLLSKVSTAAHGTKRIESDDIRAVNIFDLSNAEQRRFVGICHQFERLRTNMSGQLTEADHLFRSLVQRAFTGKLL